ncbi:MAG: UDP-N-acetylmuramoyl-tripeptide--D-alanyl-D-alanine ligase [Candidatus Nitronauta litoralis]|uniref:UDP-N-acetylmuramoyl-tripeptide--D-alanyl-D-alanine ligase n=1 Tax=Candidatus Nitronauta litoralis TaxID=2705533 RepID=A0A7T0BTN9_9BACT|nr:MAG: UDP-N-acetylmuramoyl-tripeptide--D-alanyl-D-alanine ligase [Candidatus Nitronauta litoralis]
MKKNFETVLTATGGHLIHRGSDHEFSGLSIDSRTLAAGELFLCLTGDRFDGHDFLADAVRKGASGLIVSSLDKLPGMVEGEGPFVVRVEDTLLGLQALAHYFRKQFSLKVVGITGTNGKSTTKEMISSISSTQFNTLKSHGNFNNHIGLPLNLLGLNKQHEVAILEMGMSAKGEIARLAQIAEPDIGLITNISEAHMVHLPTVRDVQSAKGELFSSLNETSCAIVNADDPLVLELAKNLRSKKITFGVDNDADVRGLDIRQSAGFGYQFSLATTSGKHPVHLPFPGRYNVLNAVAAAATGFALGLAPEQIVKGLETSKLLGQRVQVRKEKGVTLIDDTYNANPRSMLEAIKTLSSLDSTGKRFLVIGDMFELGNNETAAHQLLGEQVAKGSIDFLVGVGDLIGLTVESAIEAGQPKEQSILFKTHEEAARFLQNQVQSGDVILFKGSRGAQMERVLKVFCGDN